MIVNLFLCVWFEGWEVVGTYVGKHAVTAPWGHEQSKGKRQGEPVSGKQMSRGGFNEGAGRALLDEPINNDD